MIHVFKLFSIVIITILTVSWTMFLIKEPFDNFQSDEIDVHNIDIIAESIQIQESPLNNIKEQHFVKLLKKGSSIVDSIKYLNGITWSKWHSIADSLKRFYISIYMMIKSRINTEYKIIYYKINKYKFNLKNKDEILLDCDFVFYKPSEIFANHLKILIYLNVDNNKLDVVFVKLVGNIHHNKKTTTVKGANLQNNEYFDIDYKESFRKEVNNTSDTFETTYSEDKEVENLLFNKIMESDLEENPDFKKNQEYIRNQNMVREKFTKHLFAT